MVSSLNKEKQTSLILSYNICTSIYLNYSNMYLNYIMIKSLKYNKNMTYHVECSAKKFKGIILVFWHLKLKLQIVIKNSTSKPEDTRLKFFWLKKLESLNTVCIIKVLQTIDRWIMIA